MMGPLEQNFVLSLCLKMHLWTKWAQRDEIDIRIRHEKLVEYTMSH
jgi:hypothetical protein